MCGSFILVSRRGYTRFVGMYVRGRRQRFRPYIVYIFLIRIPRKVELEELAMSVHLTLSVRPYKHFEDFLKV